MKTIIAGAFSALLLAAAAGHADAQVLVSGRPLLDGVTLEQVQGLIPQPANVVPPSEASSPSMGAAVMRYALEDHVHARITRATTCVTTTGSVCTATWPAMASVPLVLPFPMVASGATQPYQCNPIAGTITTTGAQIKCFQPQSILGLGLLPFNNGPVGMTVQIFAIPVS